MSFFGLGLGYLGSEIWALETNEHVFFQSRKPFFVAKM